MVLVTSVQFHEVTAPTPYAHNEVAVIFWMLLRIKQTLAINSVQLQLVTTAKNKQLYKLSDFVDGFRLCEAAF